MQTLVGLVERLSDALPATTEIVLHDLRKLPSSIVAVAGNVTHRSVGDPPTDVLLEYMASGSRDDLLRYPTDLPDGRKLQSSTLIFRTVSGKPLAALCVNNEVTHWIALRQVADLALGAESGTPTADAPIDLVVALAGAATGDAADSAPTAAPHGEWFAHSVDELAGHMIEKAINEIGVPVGLMRKEHKIRVVAELEARGMFLIRDAIETVAASLEVSRFTIYNYLNELAAGSKTAINTRARSKASNE
jgi:predicted transcriptional regulator YheO